MSSHLINKSYGPFPTGQFVLIPGFLEYPKPLLPKAILS